MSFRISNVLVDASGCAQLTDYGFGPINSSASLTTAGLTAGNGRWLAPEIIRPPDDQTDVIVESMQADIFAFAMVAIEVFTGKRPFEGKGSPSAANRIVERYRPEFPENAEEVGLVTHMKELIQKCWEQDPVQRPTIDEVVKALEDLVANEENARKESNDNPAPHLEESQNEPGPMSPPAETRERPVRTDARNSNQFWKELVSLWRNLIPRSDLTRTHPSP